MVKLALIGCGKHMQNTIIPYLMRIEGCTVEVCVDVNEDAARRVQQLSYARSLASSVNDINARVIDAAIVAVPGNEAYHIARNLLSQNIPCFIEKPPASTTEEIADLLTIARKTHTYVQVGFNFRYAEAIEVFHSRVMAHIGEPFSANIEFKSKHPVGAEWDREDPVEAWLYHNGVHALDLVYWMVGGVSRVHAELIHTQDQRFLIVALIHHHNKSISTVKLGNLTEKFDLRLEVTTSDAHQFSLPHLGEVILAQRDGRTVGEILYRTPNLDNGFRRTGYGPELQHFIHRSQHESSSPSLHDALQASQFCDAIIHSLHTGQPCMLS